MGLIAGGAVLESSSVGWTCSGLGVSSTVECLPVVHGGMLRNSSKVSTRGLQHFQPDSMVSFTDEVVCVCMKWARRHLSVLHGILEDQDGIHIRPRSLCMTCRSPCARTSEPLLATRLEPTAASAMTVEMLKITNLPKVKHNPNLSITLDYRR